MIINKFKIYDSGANNMKLYNKKIYFKYNNI